MATRLHAGRRLSHGGLTKRRRNPGAEDGRCSARCPGTNPGLAPKVWASGPSATNALESGNCLAVQSRVSRRAGCCRTNPSVGVHLLGPAPRGRTTFHRIRKGSQCTHLALGSHGRGQSEGPAIPPEYRLYLQTILPSRPRGCQVGDKSYSGAASASMKVATLVDGGARPLLFLKMTKSRRRKPCAFLTLRNPCVPGINRMPLGREAHGANGSSLSTKG
jgi:hypothetical protein